MTLVVAVRRGRTVAVGSDSYISNSYVLGRRQPSHVYKHFRTSFGKEKTIIGGCGDYRVLQVVREIDYSSIRIKRYHVIRSLSREFVPRLREALREHGVLRHLRGRDSMHNTTLLIVLRGRFYLINQYMSVAEEPNSHYAAIGEDDLGRGILACMHHRPYAARTAEEPLDQLCRTVLVLASRNADTVKPPFHVSLLSY